MPMGGQNLALHGTALPHSAAATVGRNRAAKI